MSVCVRCTLCGSLEEHWDVRYALKAVKTEDPMRETIHGLIEQSEDTLSALRDNEFLKSDWKLQRRFIEDMHERLSSLAQIVGEFTRVQNKKVEEGERDAEARRS